MSEVKNKVDVDFSEQAVPQSSRRNVVTMFMVMLGFTFFSASMWVGQSMAQGLDFGGFVSSILLGGVILRGRAVAVGHELRIHPLLVRGDEQHKFDTLFG